VNPGPERWTGLARRFDLGQVRGAAEFVARGAIGYALFAWSAGHCQISTSAISALLDSYAAALGTDPALGRACSAPPSPRT
jgi:hypothetical protein